MTALSTHDTKRSEDVRARISVISEIAAATGRPRCAGGTGWPRSATGRWPTWSGRPRSGAWPIERDRLHAYAEKAAREAGVSTAWIDPDAAFEERLHALVDAVYDDAELHAGITGDGRPAPRRSAGRTRCPPS